MSGDDTEDDTTASETGRRGLLKWIVGVGVLGAVGAGGVLGWQFITRPEVTDVGVERGETTNVYRATVRNRGGPGDVLVTLSLRDESGEDVLQREREITMEADGERQVTVEVDPPSAVDGYFFDVEPTDFPERLVV